MKTMIKEEQLERIRNINIKLAKRKKELEEYIARPAWKRAITSRYFWFGVLLGLIVMIIWFI